MGLFESLRDRYILKPLADQIINRVGASTEKAAGAQTTTSFQGMPVLRNQLQTSPNYGPGQQKPFTTISWEALRSFSVQYEIARACINRRKRQITQLEWDIVAAESDDKTDYSAIIRPLKQQFIGIGGYRVRFRELLDQMIEDLLVLDAMALYKQRTYGGEVISLMPVDGSTIRLRVDTAGSTPMPPEIAFTQVVRGKVVAELTADDMIYEMMNPRTNTPYGLSPMESLIITISSALKSDLYNLAYLTDGNIPEGFFSVPETWSSNQIQEFQEVFDSAIAGDPKATSRIRFMPPGSYIPTKKPSDMAFEQFNEWLMKKTCMLFDIQPQELGFTHQLNKANAQSQSDIAIRSGIRPLANFLNEIFTDVIQQDLGFEHLAFKFMVPEDKDSKAEAEANEILIRSGQRTINEIRASNGDDPIQEDWADQPLVLGTPVFLDQAREGAEAADEAAEKANNDPEPVVPAAEVTPPEPAKAFDPAAMHVQLVSELRKFRTYALARKKDGKSIREFTSKVLPETVVEELNKRVAAADLPETRSIFKEYMQDYQIDFLADVADLKREIAEVV